MPIIQPTIEKIEVQLSDRIFNDTIIKQVAIFTRLEHRQHPETKVCSALVDVLVKSYSNDNGVNGIHLHDKGVYDRTVPLVADNNTVVRATTGEIVSINPMPFPNQAWKIAVDAIAENQDVMYQGDFFWMLRESQEINIGGLIRQHILAADQMGKFA
ncbi:hypothetical protein ACFST9_04265 [Hymenobacter monticola]|uniref:Uncharacterized protein n=1 Tax=Hymenobacter monticola TaxID=1705399 RepID=A0ABY4B465_9BACT|nr:hypothetical protein [Hymenobacter monticola]UOE32831.1 hypothetical protein MTP16_17055 [Hymenobacter monticola]